MGPAFLRAIPQSEQGLLATERRTSARDFKYLILGQIRGREPAGNRGKCAVVTAIAAQAGEGDEYLATVGDDSRTTGCLQTLITETGRNRAQRIKILGPRTKKFDDLLERKTLAGFSSRKSTSHSRGRHPRTAFMM